MLRHINSALDRLSRLALIFAAIGIVAMVVIVGWQVWGRYVLNDTPHWSERLAIFIMNWFILIGAAVGVHERFHIGLVFFKEAMPKRIQFSLEIIIHLATSGFALAMIVYGLQLAETTWSHTIPTLGLPTGLQYIPFGLSGALIILFSANHLVKLFTEGLPPDALGPDVVESGDTP
ncbi:MAG: TRAP transporter small permease [Alphaproteobacteria bacterium]|nr:TRAP transporter small permease [Alphaproteobacteria bacterium]